MIRELVYKLFAGKPRYQHLFETLGNISFAVRYIGYQKDTTKYQDEVFLVKKILAGQGDNFTFLDVGANIGNFSGAILAEATKQAKNCKIYAFEPANRTYKELYERYKDNGNVTCINKGLSDKEGTAELFSDSENSDLASVYQLKNAYRDFDNKFTQTIHLSTLDAFVQQEGITCIDYLKIDAEGHDFHVVKGGAKSLKKKMVKVIQFEFGTPNIDSRIFFRDFWDYLSNDYNFYRMIENGLTPITKYTPLNELFVTTNYVAILK